MCAPSAGAASSTHAVMRTSVRQEASDLFIEVNPETVVIITSFEGNARKG